MPPVNTPARSPASPATPPPSSPAARPLTPLSYLSSPAPDLASTLHTSITAEHADEANVSFLRDSLQSLDRQSPPSRGSHIDLQRDPRQREQPAASTSHMSGRSDGNEDASRQERLRRVLGRLNRLHEPSAPSSSAYSNRTPSPNRQSLYDWAPGSDEHEQEDSALYNILAELRRQQPDTHPDILRILSQSQLETTRQREREASALAAAENDMSDALERLDRLERRSIARRERDRRARDTEWLSLRSRAMLQRARQDGGGASPSGTDRMLRYVMERERSGMSEEEERARGSGWFRPGAATSREETGEQSSSASVARGHWLLPPPAEQRDRERERQERVEAFRRGYLPENVPQRLPRVSTPPVPPVAASPSPRDSATSLLENALKYLSDLRYCTRYEDALSAAMDHGLATREFFADKHEDFIMDFDELPPIAASSWLQPGATFEGHQHATIATLRHQARPSRSRVEQINPNYRTSNPSATAFDHPPGSTRVTPFDGSRPWQFTVPTSIPSSSKEAHDHWPVRVIIHSINPEKMTLQGTMEAYDVPQHPSGANIAGASERPKAGKKHAPITTYLEGHIIDLRTHGFLTPDSQNAKQRASNPPSAPSLESVHFPSASAQTDAENWLKLPPFSDLSTFSPTLTAYNATSTTAQTAADTSRLLLSKNDLARLQREYIFMRWKERCFVHSLHNDPCTAPLGDRHGDQDRGHGLTISGFYYVSLRRSDGVVEGLYFDPLSTPYQHLRLRGVGKGWGAWEFR